MFNFLLNFFTSLRKILVHFLTGKCELERAVDSLDFTWFENSLRASKMLTGILNRRDISSQVDHILLVKKIPNSKRDELTFVLGCVLTKLDSVAKIEGLRRKFDEQRDEHLLQELWSLLMPNTPYQRITRQWIDLGFQGEDPITDLRGAGLLGLLNLVYFCRHYPQQAQQILRDSQNPLHQYFFCSAGLYVTMHIYNMMGRLSHHFYTLRDPLTKFNDLYSHILVRLNAHFIVQPNANFMAFNMIAIHFFRTDDRMLYR